MLAIGKFVSPAAPVCRACEQKRQAGMLRSRVWWNSFFEPLQAPFTGFLITHHSEVKETHTMAVKVGINGFGRIGRNVLRAALGNKDIEFVAVNDLTSPATLAHLLKRDSILGNLPNEIEAGDDYIAIDGKKIKVFAERDPAKLPWADVGAQVVVESTGHFTDATKAKAHLGSTVKKVIISAPASNEDITIVLGVNEDKYDPAKHNVISNASCTTNCLAPVVKVLMKEFGLVSGIMTTIHSYTNDQVILDFPHKDLRRARAAALNMIPSSTGAAKALKLVIPETAGKLDGFAIRVPTPNVSIVDLTFISEKTTDAKAVNAALKAASEGAMKGILGYEEHELVSSDFKGDRRSSIVDAPLTKVVGQSVKVLSWYDNEWGYSNRVVDLIGFLAKKGL
jgi:glyceraldehyde 3-phosphate dehydrogenase (phosphorylating)